MKKDRLYWRTREGALIRVTSLTDSHLVNIMRMLSRNAEKVRLAGELAIELAERAVAGIADWSDAEVLNESFPCFRALCREVIKRNLCDAVPFEIYDLYSIKNPIATLVSNNPISPGLENL